MDGLVDAWVDRWMGGRMDVEVFSGVSLLRQTLPPLSRQRRPFPAAFHFCHLPLESWRRSPVNSELL